MEGRQGYVTKSPFSTLLLPISLLLLCWLGEVAHCWPHCPKECSCLGTFVSCDKFTGDTLHALPRDLQELVLVRGTVHSLPRPLLKLFPDLSFLEIQSTDVEAIAEGTFSEAKGLEYLAIVDSRVGSIETGAFSDMVNVSRVLISRSQVGTIQPGAFSGISRLQELSISSSSIEEVRPRAFEDLSDVGSFTFSHNNVTALTTGAFQNVKNFGKVDMSRNIFSHFEASAVVPLAEASEETDVLNNTVLCQCSSIQAFRRPAMVRFLQSQVCAMPETGEVLNLSEVNITQLCLSQPTTNPATPRQVTRERTDLQMNSTAKTTSSFFTPTHPAPDASTTSRSAIRHPTTPKTSSSRAVTTVSTAPGTKPPNSSTFSHGTDWNSRPATATRVPDVTVTKVVTAAATVSHLQEDDGDGGFTENLSKLQKNRAVSAKQTSFVSVWVPHIVVWLILLPNVSSCGHDNK